MNEQLYKFLENHPEAPIAQQLFNEEQLEEFALSKQTKKAFKIGGTAIGTAAAGVAGTAAYLNKLHPEQGAWYNTVAKAPGGIVKTVSTGFQGIKDNPTQLQSWVNPTGGGLIAAGAGALAGGAALARHLYLKKRMKQTGTSSTAAFKKVASARKAEKTALRKIAGMNRGKLKTRLSQKFGY